MAGVDAGMLLISLGMGGLLGFFYFGGLWLTVRRLAGAQRPGLWVLASFVVRLALLLPLLLWLGSGQFDRLLAALLGILAMRFYLTRRWGPEGDHGHHT